MATEKDQLRFESACTQLQATADKFAKLAYGAERLQSAILRADAREIYTDLYGTMEKANMRLGS